MRTTVISYRDEFIVRGGEAAKLEPQLLRLSFFLRFREHGGTVNANGFCLRPPSQ